MKKYLRIGTKVVWVDDPGFAGGLLISWWFYDSMRHRTRTSTWEYKRKWEELDPLEIMSRDQ